MIQEGPDLRSSGQRRILVVATETLGGATLHDVLGAHGEPPAQVLVIAPALNSRLRYWLSDEDEARRAAGVRLAAVPRLPTLRRDRGDGPDR